MRQRYTAEQVAEALRYGKGMVSVAAKRLRCDPETVYNYCKRYPTVRAVREDARCELLDMAEIRLWEAVQRGDMYAVYFVLRTLGRERGYVVRTEEKIEAAVVHGTIEEWEQRLQAAHMALEARRSKTIEALPEGHTNGLVAGDGESL